MVDGKAEKILGRVRDLLDRGNTGLARKLLLPLVKVRNGEALFIYSMFSNPGESDEEFEVRSVELLREAAALGCSPAIYALGSCYLSGDLVDKDLFVSSLLFKCAAERGHAQAMLAHGLNLFNGSNGIDRDEILGVEFIKKAGDEGVEDAEEELRKMNFGKK